AREVMDVDIPLLALFESPTVEQLATRIEQNRRELRNGSRARLVPCSRAAVLPPSFSQERLWFLEQLEGAGAAYHMPDAWEIRGSLDCGALRSSFGELVRRHESLRTRFAIVHGQVAQVIDPPQPFHLP